MPMFSKSTTEGVREVTFCRDEGRAFQAIAACTRYDFREACDQNEQKKCLTRRRPTVVAIGRCRDHTERYEIIERHTVVICCQFYCHQPVKKRHVCNCSTPAESRMAIPATHKQGRSWVGCRGGFYVGGGGGPGSSSEKFSVLRWLNPLKFHSKHFGNPRDTGWTEEFIMAN